MQCCSVVRDFGNESLITKMEDEMENGDVAGALPDEGHLKYLSSFIGVCKAVSLEG